ncbi:hypothetical protein HQ865_02825 [Mucilaginibacter mali]|uniref:Heme-binding protein n=1 Tax=Mucilaginibacter mali TaxID=2740462 RepID=A0A7D4TM12_9SPHI|nr:hypothetical protein [Mucilaginibacter mali]QKJ28734.1 hypothetical protein HQ865_02825 [Mucilaginibacter mali]
MKRSQLPIVCFLLLATLCAFTLKQDKTEKDEQVFFKHADEALSAIEQGAGKLNIKGVAIVMFVPGDSVRSWVSKMKIVGQMKKGSSNLLGVASAKAAEMADTYQDSGSGIRPPLKGEYGYKGGVMKKVRSGYVMAVFSGGSPDQDKEAATGGAELLAKYFN